MEKKTKTQRINDKILNKLSEREDLHKNELFIFWDIFRSCYGEFSCIDEHERIAGEILSEIDYEDKEKGTAEVQGK